MNGVSNGAIGTLNEDQFYFSQLEPCDNCELNPLPVYKLRFRLMSALIFYFYFLIMFFS